jgi:hypothetical protein
LTISSLPVVAVEVMTLEVVAVQVATEQEQV